MADPAAELSDQAPPYDARSVANFILELCDLRGVPLTQMKLYKLLYFAHGWYLHQFARPLVWNQFEAWENGPVVKALRDCFKAQADAVIHIRARVFDFALGKEIVCSESIASSDRLFIEGVVAQYLELSAFQLSDLTHERGTPWDALWNNPQPVGRFALRMTDEEIKRSFDRAAIDM